MALRGGGVLLNSAAGSNTFRSNTEHQLTNEDACIMGNFQEDERWDTKPSHSILDLSIGSTFQSASKIEGVENTKRMYG